MQAPRKEMRSVMIQQSNQSFNPEYFENLWNGYADEDYDVVIILSLIHI